MDDFKRSNVTIDQIASLAKVSKTTISRYLNGKYEYMSAQTRKRIEQVIEEQNYRPSNIARSLKAKRSGLLGCIVADIASTFSSILLKGINDVCTANGYRMIFANVDNNPESERQSIHSLLDNRVDGLIVNTTGYVEAELLALRDQGLPIVLADRYFEDPDVLDTVTTDNHNIVVECIEHLYRQGYTRVAFFSEAFGKISSRTLRHRAYLGAMQQYYNQDANRYTYFIDTRDKQVCMRHLQAFVQSAPDEPKAIFTVNGVTLLSVLQAMNEMGYSIDERLGICGFDDWGWASLIPPGITTITQDSYAVGVRSAELLLRRIEGERDSRTQFIELPNRLVLRGSTDLAKMRAGS